MSNVYLSVVAPAHNEEDNIDQLIEEIAVALSDASYSWEVVLVDDGSTDGTLERMIAAQARHSELRVIRMLQTPSGSGNGQSAAFYAAFRAARGSIIVVLDADLQNDPADIPRLVTLLDEQDVDLVQGDRSQNRRDTIVRRASSFVGRTFRWMLLGDTIRDTGCSLRVMRREVALRLPLEFRGMHRFIPVTARQLGYRVIEEPVHHRPRVAGVAKYGIWNRAIPGLIDCFAVRWMRRRRRPVAFEECRPAAVPMRSESR